MGKTGWQIVAGISMSFSVLFAAAAFNTQRHLDLAYAELRARQQPPAYASAAAPPNPVPHSSNHPDYNKIQLINELQRDGKHRCIRGQLFRIENGTFVQLGSCPRLSSE